MMHSRHRSFTNQFRPTPADGGGYFATSARRSFGRRNFSSPRTHYHSNHHAPPPSSSSATREPDVILLEAGRLAAEYLASKGLIPASLLPSPPRASALSRLSSGDDSWKQLIKSRRRHSPYDRSYGPENDDDYDEAAPGFSKSQRIEVVEESMEDSASKVSSSGNRKDTQIETEVNSNTENLREDNSENGDAEMKSFPEGDKENGSDSWRDLLKLLSFNKVPTRPRSSSVQKNVNTVEETSMEDKSIVSKVVPGDFQNSNVEDTKTNGDVSVPDAQPMVQDDGEKQHESREVAPALEKEENLALNSANGEEDSINNVGGVMLDQYSEDMMQDESHRSMHETPVLGAELLPKVDSELSHKIENEEQRQLQPASFKMRDLNLMEGSEKCDKHAGPSSNYLSTTTIRDIKEDSRGFPLPLVDSVESADKRRPLSGCEKVVPIIDLEDDCPGEALVHSPPRTRSSSIFQDLNPALNCMEHPIDLPSIQDSYSLMAPELLENGIAGCTTVQPDLNNLQNSFGLPGAEEFPADYIYETFGRLPMGFIEDWDQPPQEYGNFF